MLFEIPCVVFSHFSGPFKMPEANRGERPIVPHKLHVAVLYSNMFLSWREEREIMNLVESDPVEIGEYFGIGC